MRVYLLGDYEEHGTENIVATLDPTRLPALLEQHAAARGWPAPDKERTALAKMLQSDELRSGDALLLGWGGTKLYVIELQ